VSKIIDFSRKDKKEGVRQWIISREVAQSVKIPSTIAIVPQSADWLFSYL
jgi:hypothetical protein